MATKKQARAGIKGGTPTITTKGTRLFNGQLYIVARPAPSHKPAVFKKKSDALKLAKDYRGGGNYRARVVTVKGGHAVFVKTT